MVSFYFLVRYNRPFSGDIMWNAASTLRHSRNPLTPVVTSARQRRDPCWGSPIGFRDPEFPLFEAQDSVFESKIGERFGIESMRGRWDAKNNPRDYRIARNFGSGGRDWGTLLGTLLVLGPLRTQRSTGRSFRISFQSDWIMVHIQILVHR